MMALGTRTVPEALGGRGFDPERGSLCTFWGRVPPLQSCRPGLSPDPCKPDKAGGTGGRSGVRVPGLWAQAPSQAAALGSEPSTHGNQLRLHSASAQGPRPPEPGACPAAGPLMHLPRCLRPPPPRGAPGVPRGTSAHFPGTPWPAVPPPLPPRRSRFVTATLADEQTAQQSRATGAEPWLRASAKPVPGHRGAATADRRAECGPSTADCPP